jgi:hypothetical protein
MPMTERKPGPTDDTPLQQEREILQAVLAALRDLRYGSVVLTVHDGHLVEIQRTEKIRMGNSRP